MAYELRISDCSSDVCSSELLSLAGCRLQRRRNGAWLCLCDAVPRASRLSLCGGNLGLCGGRASAQRRGPHAVRSADRYAGPQGFTQAIAAISLPNDASIKLHEALGFFRAGVYREIGFKHGAWRDVGLWQRELATAEVPPPEPRSFKEVEIGRAH